MKIALDWPGLRAGAIHSRRSRDANVRRVASRLAAQTVVLLLVMLVILEGVVYIITQQGLLGSLEATLRSRAGQADPTACSIFHLTCSGQDFNPRPGQQPGFGGRGAPPGPGGPRVFAPISGPSDASATYVNPHMQVVHADGVIGSALLGPGDVRNVLHSGQELCCTVHSYKEQDYLVFTAPLKVGGKTVGAVQTSISEHQYEQTRNAVLSALLAVTLLGLLGSGGISVVLVQRALRPIRLAMKRQRDFVADAAHELRTPLAIQRTVGEVGMSDPAVDDLQATVEQMLGENRHLTRLVEDLSLLARADTDAVAIDRQPVDLSVLVRDTVQELSYVAGEKGVVLDADVHGRVTTPGDILRLRQLLLILLDNALKHTPAGGTVHVQLTADNGRPQLQILDSGPGIDPADLGRVFDRFYRSDRARSGEGTGLGLAVAKWIVEAHGGHIRAGNTSSQGAVFTVTLPQAGPATA